MILRQVLVLSVSFFLTAASVAQNLPAGVTTTGVRAGRLSFRMTCTGIRFQNSSSPSTWSSPGASNQFPVSRFG